MNKMYEEVKTIFEPEDAVALMEGELHPSELADLKVKLAASFFFLSGRMDLCDKKEVEYYKCIDDAEEGEKEKMTEAKRKRFWKQTEWGLEQTLIKNRMRAIDRLTSAISSKIKTAEIDTRLER